MTAPPTLFFTAGSCGPCRFGMYEAEYRLAVQNAGFDGLRILLFQQNDGIKAASGEPGLKFTVDFGLGALDALTLGDIMNDVAYQIRPFEVNAGETDRVFTEVMADISDHFRERQTFEIADRLAQGDLGMGAEQVEGLATTEEDARQHSHLQGALQIERPGQLRAGRGTRGRPARGGVCRRRDAACARSSP